VKSDRNGPIFSRKSYTTGEIKMRIKMIHVMGLHGKFMESEMYEGVWSCLYNKCRDNNIYLDR
jgi:hypothetical protein